MNVVARVRRIARVVLVTLSIVGVPAVAASQESVTITLPTMITFAANLSGATTGSPAPSRVEFSNAVLVPLKVLRISVIADSTSFINGGTASIPASHVSWSVTNASGGTGTNGTLSSGAFTQIFQGAALTGAGGFDVTWTLADVPTVRAGSHTLTLRWKVESVFP